VSFLSVSRIFKTGLQDLQDWIVQNLVNLAILSKTHYKTGLQDLQDWLPRPSCLLWPFPARRSRRGRAPIPGSLHGHKKAQLDGRNQPQVWKPARRSRHCRTPVQTSREISTKRPMGAWSDIVATHPGAGRQGSGFGIDSQWFTNFINGKFASSPSWNTPLEPKRGQNGTIAFFLLDTASLRIVEFSWLTNQKVVYADAEGPSAPATENRKGNEP
jgi:hypothetical protein